MHRLAALVGLAVVPMLSVGCGPNCQSTCSRLYQEVNDGCAIERPGRSLTELMNTCMDSCESALSNPGEIGDYDPYNTRASASDVSIDTDRQAAIWMECIAETSCDNLDGGFCPPVW